MAEAADELSTPLGQQTMRKARRFRLPFTAMQALAVLLGLFLVTFFGIALFTAASLLGGLAQSSSWLLAARALQGIGAAIAAPRPPRSPTPRRSRR